MSQKSLPRPFRLIALVSALLIITLSLVGCSNPEKMKAEHVRRGNEFLKEKKYQEASIEFRNAIQIDDNLADAHWGLAQANEGLERYGEAFEEMRRTVSLDPNNLDARVRLGNYYLAPPNRTTEMIAEADRLAKEVLQKDANHIEGHILMATVLYAQDPEHPDKALAELKRAIEINPKRVESHLSLARFYVALKDVTRSEETFKTAISVDDKSSLAHSEFGKFLAQLGRLNEAEAEFKRAVEVDPQNRNARHILASFYLVNKQLDKAEEAYKALADLDKDKPEGRAVLADFYSAVNRTDEAIALYREINKSAPDYARGRYRLGEILLQRGDVNGATEQVQEVLAKNERDMQALLLRARIRLQAGQSKETKAAVEDLKEVLKQEPNSRSGLYFMSQAQLALGQIDQARSYSGDLERFYPEYLPGKLLQVQINFAANDSKTALRLCNELIEKLDKSGPDRETTPQLLAELRSKALTARGLAQLQLNKLTEARADLTAARDAAPNSPSSYNNLAVLAAQEAKWDEAIGHFERALSLDKANFDALNGLIKIYVQQQRLDQAHARVDQALGAQPNNPSLHYLKAQVFGYEKNAQGAEAELRRTLEIDPNYIAAYSSLAALFVNMNQQDRAIAEYRKILEHSPDNASAYTLIGILESSRGNHDEAVKNYSKALELDPNSAIAANNLAWIYAVYNKGNLDEAVRLAQGAVQRNPDVPGFADTLGWVYYKKNLHGAAVEQLQKVVQREGANPVYRFHLGMAMAGQGNKAGAKRELEQALKLAEGKNFAEADEARRTLATL